MKILVENIRLESRERRENEFNVMRGVVFDLSEDDRGKVYSIFCDSAATTYNVVLSGWDEVVAKDIARKIEHSLWRHVGGFNGITIDGGEHIGLDLPLYARWPGYPARHYTIPGEWRDDITIGAVYELLFKLPEMWPNTFDAKAPVPLKIGIFAEVVLALPERNSREIKMALGHYCRAEKYLRALIERIPRRNLRGQEVGTVTPEQVAIAKRYLGTVVEEIAP